MEQPCYKCGEVVEEGRPFCRHCAAPQIRVVIAEPLPIPAPATDAATTAPSQPSVKLPASESVPLLAAPTQLSHALKDCAIAALVASLLMSLGLNVVVAMLSAGFLVIVFYRQGRPGLPVKASTGFRLGVFSGLLCFGLSTLLAALAATVPELRAKTHDQFIEGAQKWVATYYPHDPNFQAALERLKTPDGFIAAMILGGVVLLILSILLGGLGGVLGAIVLGRRDRR
ncbi:MAG TPA: hypothetical protein VE377_00420 [Candidatus Dormibacteraeota bacterium]|nr:hypothetical protein [Candidatus Dormibacteraeota bacterium]